MEYTDEPQWWLVGSDRESNYKWTRVQAAIGVSRFGAVEGPASFKDHSQPNRWYLFVDDLRHRDISRWFPLIWMRAGTIWMLQITS